MYICSFEAHQVRQLIDDELTLSCAFMDAFDAAALPVCPVNIIPQQREAEDVRKFVLHQHPSTRPIHVHHLRQTGEKTGDSYRQLHLFNPVLRSVLSAI